METLRDLLVVDSGIGLDLGPKNLQASHFNPLSALAPGVVKSCSGSGPPADGARPKIEVGEEGPSLKKVPKSVSPKVVMSFNCMALVLVCGALIAGAR